MQVYQLYCASSIFKSFVRRNPSLVLTYTADNTELGMDGWLYDKNGKKPVRNSVGFPQPASDPQFEMLKDITVAPVIINPFSFQLLNISNELYDKVMDEIANYSALSIVIKPINDIGKLNWEVNVSTEAEPPFKNLFPVPLLQLSTNFNPSPPKELAQ